MEINQNFEGFLKQFPQIAEAKEEGGSLFPARGIFCENIFTNKNDMSWDVYLIKSATNDEATPEEIENTVPVTTKSELYDWLRQNYPEIDLAGEGYPVLFAEEYSVEFMLYEEEQQLDQIWLSIRGDEAPYELIETMCRAFDCRAVDMGTGGFLEGEETSSFGEWKDFREQVKAEYEAADEKGWRGMLRSFCGWFTGK